MDGVYYWDSKNDDRRTEGSQEEQAAPVPDAAFIPKVKISDTYTGRYRWTGPERLWLSVPEDPSPKKK